MNLFRNTFWVSLIVGCVVICFTATCKKEGSGDPDLQVLRQYLNVPQSPYEYADPDVPEFYNSIFIQNSDNTPIDNPITNWGATLGRVLFYDKALSINNTISCASCHRSEFGFSDTAVFSTGFNGGVTGRHSMGLVNARYYMNERFFWDERAQSLEHQTLMPIQDTVEMGMTLDAVFMRLRNTDYYPILFRKAFGDTTMNSDRLSKAIAQFVRSMISYTSKFDEGRTMVSTVGEPFPNFTAQENRGKGIFFNRPQLNCGSCHHTELMIGDVARNNGLEGIDPGLGGVTGQSLDNFKFKTPSLKNIAIRAPYMHDGRFKTLREVIEHYSSGIKKTPNLDNHLVGLNGEPLNFNFTEAQIQDLIAFLNTLTDTEMLNDQKFSDPFL